MPESLTSAARANRINFCHPKANGQVLKKQIPPQDGKMSASVKHLGMHLDAEERWPDASMKQSHADHEVQSALAALQSTGESV